jgi:hypothetical protein
LKGRFHHFVEILPHLDQRFAENFSKQTASAVAMAYPSKPKGLMAALFEFVDSLLELGDLCLERNGFN